MKRTVAVAALCGLLLGWSAQAAAARRVVLFKFDGVNADLLEKWMSERDPRTGRSRLPWMNEIFVHGGTRFSNFYVRGISLSAPSWSELDTGHHEVIRGNVEYDRWTLHPYDYLNFFPFYVNYSRKTQVDMPGTEVLDAAGIPLLLDAFRPDERWQSYQLFQRGNTWGILQKSLPNHFGGRTPQQLFDEYETGLELAESVSEETERQLIEALADDKVAYLDFFSGDYDHVAHLTTDPESQLRALQGMDVVVGRIVEAARASKLGPETLFVMVSDHGMNTAPDILSQGYSFVRWFGSAAGGGHHVVTDRHPLSTFKIRGLDPFVHKVTTAGADATYLKGEADRYPTALLDVDGNERAGVQLRSSTWNVIHILLEETNRADLAPPLKAAASAELRRWAETRMGTWVTERAQLTANLDALQRAAAKLEATLQQETTAAQSQGKETVHDLELRRLKVWAARLRDEHREYSAFRKAMDDLLAMPPNAKPDRMPRESLGDANTLYDLQNYVVGLAPGGLALRADGRLDFGRSFRHVNYLEALPAIRVRNQTQKAVGIRPVDFVALALDVHAAEQAFGETALSAAVFLHSDKGGEAVLLYRNSGTTGPEIRYVPVTGLQAQAMDDGTLRWESSPWAAGLPLGLWEDTGLQLPAGADRQTWLGAWHPEADWFTAVMHTRYTNAVIGLGELFGPLETRAPVWSGMLPETDRKQLAAFELWQRQQVQPDFEIFAADHWNFNVRNFNPGGNHGGFFRQSTHSVLMFAGAGVPAGAQVEHPYDSLSFAPTLLDLLGRTLPEGPLPGKAISELITSGAAKSSTR